MEQRSERPEGAATAERTERVARRPVAPPKRPRRRRGPAVSDPVGDMLTRVRNASRARHDTVSIPASKMKAEIARILKAEGFVSGYDVSPTAITLRLKYVDGRIPAVTDLKRISRPGLRVYAGGAELPYVRGGLGVSIVSTSQGLMTGREAARKRLGGEVLCAVW